jgi:hypothetical protein
MVFTPGPGLLSDATLTYSDAKRRFAPFEIKLTACSVLLFEQTAKFRRAVVWFPKLPNASARRTPIRRAFFCRLKSRRRAHVAEVPSTMW